MFTYIYYKNQPFMEVNVPYMDPMGCYKSMIDLCIGTFCNSHRFSCMCVCVCVTFPTLGESNESSDDGEVNV